MFSNVCLFGTLGIESPRVNLREKVQSMRFSKIADMVQILLKVASKLVIKLDRQRSCVLMIWVIEFLT